jgi:biopolymer transport protein ExbD
MNVELPKAASGGDAVESTLNVVVTKDGDLLLDGAETTTEQLAAAVRREREGKPELQAVIAADKGVPYGRVVHVIDVVKTNGVTSFALNIERSAAPTE